MTPDDLTYLPEPSLSAMVSGNYMFDKAGTDAHYDALFKNRTATDIIAFLTAADVHISYNSETEISILVNKRVVFFEYGIGISFIFADGVYASSEVWSWGAK